MIASIIEMPEKQPNTVPIMVRLPKSLHERLKAIADADDRSMNKQIIRVLEAGLAAGDAPKKRPKSA